MSGSKAVAVRLRLKPPLTKLPAVPKEPTPKTPSSVKAKAKKQFSVHFEESLCESIGLRAMAEQLSIPRVIRNICKEWEGENQEFLARARRIKAEMANLGEEQT